MTTVVDEKQQQHIWVLGGGLAGLATAAALRVISGCEHVTVLECSSESDYYDDTAGAVAKIGPNGLLALQTIDEQLATKIISDGHILKALAMVQAGSASGEVTIIPDCTLEDTGLPQTLIRWGILRRTLQELLPKESIFTGIGADICGYEVVTGDDGQQQYVRLINELGENIGPKDLPPPSLIVAADGLNSSFQSLVRNKAKVLSGPDAPAIRKSNVQDNGRVNVNAVVRMKLDYERYNLELEAGTALAYSAPDNSVACFCASAGTEHTSWAISVADAIDETGSVVQFFAKCDSPDPTTANAATHIKDYLVSTLKNLNDRQCQFAIDLIEATDPTALFVRRSQQLTLIGSTFVSDDGKVVLVGDCGHAMSPSYGQGFNFAFEDAVTLALCMRGGQIDRNALQTYSDLRIDRCEEMFRRSAERVVKQMKGEKTEDVLKWISNWKLPELEGHKRKIVKR